MPFSNEGSHPHLIGVHRFFSAEATDYVLTTDPVEIAALSQDGSGFSYDGVAFTGIAEFEPGTTAVHRFYSKTSTDHLYTTNFDEVAGVDGYDYEGIAWYAIDLRSSVDTTAIGQDWLIPG